VTHATDAADVQTVAASVAQAGRGSVAALIFFGSRKTQARTDEHSAHDFFLLTPDYSSLYRSLVASGSVHRPAWLLSGLNAVLPPNVISIRPSQKSGETWRAKCAVATVDCFVRETSAARHDHFFMGRMFQPTEIVFAADDAVLPPASPAAVAGGADLSGGGVDGFLVIGGGALGAGATGAGAAGFTVVWGAGAGALGAGIAAGCDGAAGAGGSAAVWGAAACSPGAGASALSG